MGERDSALERAFAYPFEIPEHSYALVDGRAVELNGAEVDCDNRVALLAYGSNASPEVLGQKLRGSMDPVPVIRTTLRDFDVVYSAHVSPYGAIPATLARSPGTEIPAFVAYLTGEQLNLLSPTEPNYEFARFDRPACTLERGNAPIELRVYLSRHGPLRLDGTEIALAAIKARNRRLPEMTQREVLERARDFFGFEGSVAQFVHKSVSGWSGSDTENFLGP